MAERFPVGKDRPYAWSRFNNHFRLASYKDLPASRYMEALEYIGQMQTKDGEKHPVIDIKSAMLSGMSNPTVQLTTELERAIEQKAISMAFEAFELSKEHLKRRVAYNCECGHPVKISPKHALSVIDKANLSNSMTHAYYETLGRIKADTLGVLDRAKRFIGDLNGMASKPNGSPLSRKEFLLSEIQYCMDELESDHDAKYVTMIVTYNDGTGLELNAKKSGDSYALNRYTQGALV